MIGGKNTTKWQNETVFYGRTNTYIMYIEDGTNHPVRYEMHGFNSLLGSHYDRYYLDYSTFAVNFSDDAWKIPASECSRVLSCEWLTTESISAKTELEVNNGSEEMIISEL